MTGICVICKLLNLNCNTLIWKMCKYYVFDRNSWLVPADTSFQRAIKRAIDFGFCESKPYHWNTGLVPLNLKSLSQPPTPKISNYKPIYRH